MRARNGFLIAAFACTAALAQAPMAGDSGTEQTAPLQDQTAPTPDQTASVQLTPKMENGITYLCGGRKGAAVGLTWPSGLRVSSPDLQGSLPPGG